MFTYFFKILKARFLCPTLFFKISTHKSISTVSNTVSLWGIWGCVWRCNSYLVPKRSEVLNTMQYVEQSPTKR